MTQKDYERLAKAIGDALVFVGDPEIPIDESTPMRQGIMVAAENIADMLLDDNERFNRECFMKAIRNYGNAHSIKLDLERRMSQA